MKKHSAVKWFAVFGSLLFLISCDPQYQASQSGYAQIPNFHHHHLAILGLGSGVLSDSEIESVATERVLDKGYAVTNDEDVDTVIAQIKNEQAHSGEFDPDSIARLTALGVDGILIVQVSGYSTMKMQDGTTQTTDIDLSARLIDTQSASTEWIRNVHSTDLGLLGAVILLPVILLDPNIGQSTTESLVDDAMSSFPPAQANPQ